VKKSMQDFIEFLLKHFQKHWLKWLAGILCFGFVVASCEIPTPWGVIKKGSVKLPFIKSSAPSEAQK